MNEQNNPPSPDTNTMIEWAKATVHSHRLKVQMLTLAAFVAGVLSLITSILVVWAYPIFVLPMQRELTHEAENLIAQYHTNAVSVVPGREAEKQFGRLLGVEIQVTNVTTAGTAVVALAVGLLGLGTLILLTVVMLNRRVALHQINASLAQISSQLWELQSTRGGP